MADDMPQTYPSEEQAPVGHVLATVGKMFMIHLVLGLPYSESN
jgi:ABC-type enterobactin transport system permease subunit